MFDDKDLLELVDIPGYGSFPLKGLSQASGMESYVYKHATFELEFVEGAD